MVDLQVQGSRIAYIDSAGDTIYLLSETAIDLDAVLSVGDSSNRSITLGGVSSISVPSITASTASFTNLSYAGTPDALIDSAQTTQLIEEVVDSDYVTLRAPEVSTANVQTANIGLTFNTVGSLTSCYRLSSGSVNPGGTVAGSLFRGVPTNGIGEYNPGASGTWRNLGSGPVGTNGYVAALFVRIA